MAVAGATCYGNSRHKWQFLLEAAAIDIPSAELAM